MEEMITAIEQQKKNKQRFSIFIDDEYSFSISASGLGGLHIGQTLDRDEVEELKQRDSFIRAKDLALNYLRYRPRSIYEVQNHLSKKGFEESIQEKVIEELTASNLLNDSEFTEYWINQREEFRPRGIFALRHELLQKRVDLKVIDAALSEVDEFESAMKASQRKAESLQGSDYQNFMQKLSSFLERRGFSYEVISDVTRAMWNQVNATNKQSKFSKGE